MMRRLFFLILITLAAARARGQTGAAGQLPVLQNSGGFLRALPNVTVTFCAAGASGSPCSPALYTFTSDANGNVFYTAVTPGDYQVTETGVNITTPLSFAFTVGIAGGSGPANNLPKYSGAGLADSSIPAAQVAQLNVSNTFSAAQTFSAGGSLTGSWAGNPTFNGNVTATGGQNTFSAYSVDNIILMDCNATTPKYPCTQAGLTAAVTACPGRLIIPTGASISVTANVPVNAGPCIIEMEPNVTLTFSSGVQLVFNVPNSGILGAGWGDVIDCSAGTSANDCVVSNTVSNTQFRNFKIIGDRVAGGTAASCISIFAGGDTVTVEDMNLLNCGNRGIFETGTTNLHIHRNTITSTGGSAIYLGPATHTGLWAEENNMVTTDVNGADTGGGITATGNNASSFDSGFHINHNVCTNTNKSCIQLNSFAFTDARITQGVEVIGNHIFGMSGSSAGECIAVTIKDFVISGNYCYKATQIGIYVYGWGRKGVISGNIVIDSSTASSGTYGAIALDVNGGGLNGTINQVDVADNTAYDDQGSHTMAYGVLLATKGSGTYSNISIHGTRGSPGQVRLALLILHTSYGPSGILRTRFISSGDLKPIPTPSGPTVTASPTSTP